MALGDRIKSTIHSRQRDLSAQAAMNTPSPFDAILPLLAAAQRNWGWPVQIEVTFSGGMKVAAPVAPMQTPPAEDRDGLPPLSDKQKAILRALLLHGPLKGESLAAKLGYKNRETLTPNRGLKELKAWGLVTIEENTGYALTEYGEDVASALEE